jgi:hypothetical protein
MPPAETNATKVACSGLKRLPTPHRHAFGLFSHGCRGNAMLVGVGGSGKQSLARLAAYICGCDVFQIAVSSTYGVADFKEALLALYTKAGAKGQPVVFLMTDNQIVKEQFLVFINDLLSTGIVADLFTPEDKDNFCNAVRNEVKATGMLDSQENCWKFFIDKVCNAAQPAYVSTKFLTLYSLFFCAAV